MKRNLIPYLIIPLIINCLALTAQTYQRDLNWDADGSSILSYYPDAAGLYFSGAMIDSQSGLPVFSSSFHADAGYSSYYPVFSETVFQPLSEAELALLPQGFHPESEIGFESVQISYFRKQPLVQITFIPLRYNVATGNIEKLISFSINISGKGVAEHKSGATYTSQSVLSTGDWLKMRTKEHGVYQVTFHDLVAAGMPVQGIHPSQLRLYGNGNRMLPEKNNDPRIDDLREVAIQVHTSDPGVFQDGDYILFYASSQHVWKPITDPLNLRFEHEWNIYTDYSFYFLTVSNGEGKRIQALQPLPQQGSHRVRTFNAYSLYKPDFTNLAKIGREWFGERIPGNSSTRYIPDMVFPNLDTDAQVRIRSRFAVKSNEISRVGLEVNGEKIDGPVVLAIPSGHLSLYARTAGFSTTRSVTNDLINIGVDYLTSNQSASAWVDYIEVNARRKMIYTGGQMHFRDLQSVGSNYTAQFMLESPADNFIIWEVSQEHEPGDVQYARVNEIAEFTFATPSLREFVAFTPDDYYSVDMPTRIANQNLHGLQPHDMVVITPAILLSEAEQYADFRRNNSDLSVLVVQVEQIYNEFSSGSVDPSAIRDFMKMLFDQAPTGKEPRYLLLFGDGSYDPKDRLPNNNNLIPAYQSAESLRLDLSFVADDYYGLLDDGEGEGAAGALDLGIGRFPVNNPAEALAMIAKLEHYTDNQGKNRGNWQNTVCYVAHDEDKDLHFIQAEEITEYVDTNHRIFNIEKIYLDAYRRLNIPGGYRYPDANRAINDIVTNGSLLVNYIGHGGETGWATSKVLTNNDILAWKNLDNMPMFLTATCQFGRFDNPELVSAGELVVRNPNGGGIALFTTSRLAYSSFNFRLNKSFTRFMFEQDENGSYYSLGELVMYAKNDNNNNLYIRNFVLLGDPSMYLLYPDYNIETTVITHNGSSLQPNELLGLSEVTVHGKVTDHLGNQIPGFNGTLFPVVYDKPEQLITLANHQDSYPKPFSIQNSVLHKGKASVVDGSFSFSFVVPRDVNPKIGQGKISYFATNGSAEAHGYYDDFVIGGIDLGLDTDSQGPEISMYLNDASFTFGGKVNETPVLYATLSDPGGINFFGLGIGHDIVAWLNDDSQNPIILSDYYNPQTDSHTGGEIIYQFQKLPEGRHTLRLKAWDLHNNSSEAYTEFFVTSSLDIVAGRMTNRPNPFSEGTYFEFHHNYADQEIEVEIFVYNLHGQHVAQIGPRMAASIGSGVEPIYWNGRGLNGNRLNPGIYIYRLRMKTANEFSSFLQGKLMIMR